MSYRFLLLGLGVAGCLSVAACSSDSKENVNVGGQPGTGGDAMGNGGATGGSPSSGGGGGGGTTESGGVTGSTGGSTQTGGASSGGTATTTGGAASTGGTTGTTDGGSTDGDAGFTPNPGTVDVVVCKADGTECTTSENCCYTRAVSFPTQTPATYTCSDKPCTGGDIALSCDGREDCHGGQSCCRVDVVGGGTSYSCRDSCNSTVIGCSGTANCPAGQVCCQHQILTTATETECSDTCTGSGSYIMCSKASECPANVPNCVNSSTVPGLRVCAQ
jgi:hypothetical protein